MKHWQTRTEMILGSEALTRLASSRVAVFGVGGVGGHAAEALARSGIGSIDLIDMDDVEETNLNRQAVALHSTIGRMKTEVMRDRILDINPECRVTCHNIFYLPEMADSFDLSGYDYIIDAVDTVTAKLCLIEHAQKAGIPILCCMGTGNRLDPSKLSVTDLWLTTGDPLAKIMRHELKKRGITKLSVVSSAELPIKPRKAEDAPEVSEESTTGRNAPGSSAFVPAAAGLLLASKVVRDLIS